MKILNLICALGSCSLLCLLKKKKVCVQTGFKQSWLVLTISAQYVCVCVGGWVCVCVCVIYSWTVVCNIRVHLCFKCQSTYSTANQRSVSRARSVLGLGCKTTLCIFKYNLCFLWAGLRGFLWPVAVSLWAGYNWRWAWSLHRANIYFNIYLICWRQRLQDASLKPADWITALAKDAGRKIIALLNQTDSITWWPGEAAMFPQSLTDDTAAAAV